jgi:acyl-CoA thioester hydrolase
VTETRIEVREYEIDSQGVVNHATILSYLEHARSQYLIARKIDYFELVKQGILLQVSRAQVRYRVPLRSGDVAVISTVGGREGAQAVFQQIIKRGSDGKTCVQAEIEIVCVIDGKPTRGEFFDTIPHDELH